MIYHVVAQKAWQVAVEQGYYESPSLASEGFIHCSKKDQVDGVLQRYYKGIAGLLLLHINEHKLTAQLIYENAPSVNEDFPHLYGRLNIDAVVEVSEIS